MILKPIRYVGMESDMCGMVAFIETVVPTPPNWEDIHDNVEISHDYGTLQIDHGGNPPPRYVQVLAQAIYNQIPNQLDRTAFMSEISAHGTYVVEQAQSGNPSAPTDVNQNELTSEKQPKTVDRFENLIPGESNGE